MLFAQPLNRIALVSGGFDPCHIGHIQYLQAAAVFGRLIVGLNSDLWLTRKKGKPFMNFLNRYSIISNLRMVDQVLDFDDYDNTANELIRMVNRWYPEDHIVFCNGGDRTITNIPEVDMWRDHPNISFQFGVGGDTKENSSSDLLRLWAIT